MSLNPINDCTVPPQPDANLTCVRANAVGIKNYPDFFSCNDDHADETYCYVVQGGYDMKTDPDTGNDKLRTAMKKCCSGDDEPASMSTCVQYCVNNTPLDQFNQCLATEGYSPGYYEWSPVVDTYCIPGSKQKANGASVQTLASDQVPHVSASHPETWYTWASGESTFLPETTTGYAADAATASSTSAASGLGGDDEGDGSEASSSSASAGMPAATGADNSSDTTVSAGPAGVKGAAGLKASVAIAVLFGSSVFFL